ncbi:MAG TPA: CHRD domain-containing protein [Vicinamibacterales bacterium]
MTRWVAFAIAVCAVAAGCDDNGTTSPSNQPAVFAAILRPANEVPPIGNAESGGNGAAQITLQLTRSTAGAITGATADFYFQVSGFPGNTTVVGAHIHPGAAGVNGPVMVNTGLTAGSPFIAVTGTGEFRATGITVTPALAQSIVDNPAGFYFNIHSPINPGGFARGQLTRIQ